MVDAPNPQSGEQGKPPKSDWEAKPKPHWVEVSTLIILAIIGFFQICIYFKQASIMQTQADIARSQLEITKRQVAPRMVMDNLEDADQNLTKWSFTPQWVNKGEFDAQNFRNWENIDFFFRGTASNFDFLAPAGVESSAVPTVPGGEYIAQRTLTIPRAWAQQSFDGQGDVVAWGYIKWNDPPPNAQEHSRHWCFLLVFEMSKGDLAMKLPRYYQPRCNKAD
jgi:hypothetical protein